MTDIDFERPCLALENSLSGEDGESFARAIEETFPVERETATNEPGDDAVD